VLAARARIAQLLFPLLGRIEGFQAASTRMHLRHDHDTQILETRVRDVQRIVQDLQRRTGHGAAGPSGAELDPVTTASVRSRLGDLPTLFDAGPVVDLRCGDGALLAALRDRGIEGIGVDDDHAAVLRCRARGHEAWVEPWPAYLAHLRRGSVAGIVVPPSLDDLPGAHRRRVLDAVVRALVPGGRVAVETRTGTTRPGDALFQDRWPLPSSRCVSPPACCGIPTTSHGASPGHPRHRHEWTSRRRTGAPWSSPRPPPAAPSNGWGGCTPPRPGWRRC
jgi:SAM-dependent methyltransferase